MTITEFLIARLDEEEAAARAVDPGGRPMESGRYLHWTVAGEGLGDRSGHVIAYTVSPAAARDHIARHDPASVLAEVEAKRRIMELVGWLDNYDIPPALSDQPSRLVLRLLAHLYADHPDYDGAWIP